MRMDYPERKTTGRLSPDKASAARPSAAILSRPDRCDADCPAEAKVRMTRHPHGELVFCLHHFHEHALALIAGGWQQVQ